MNYLRRHIQPREWARGTAAILVAGGLVIVILSALLSGCGGFASSSRNASDKEGLATTRTSAPRTTTTTLSLHERIQQEQTALVAEAATPGQDPVSRSTSSNSTAASSTTLAPVVVLTDGSTMSLEEADAIQAYVDGILPLVDEQYELTVALDPDSSFDFGNVTPSDVEQYRAAIQRQQTLRDELAGIQAPTYMSQSHELRVLAAKQIYEAAVTMIAEIERGNYHPEDSELMSTGRSQFETGLDTLADSEFGLELWGQAIDGAYIQ